MSKQDFPKVVSIPNPLYQSLKGRYFVGQTETIRLGEGKNAWGGLLNPSDSNVDLFVNAFTITNHSDQPIEALIWFNPGPLPNRMNSKKVTPANTAIHPLPMPKVRLAFGEIVGLPKRGVNAFKRIVPPQSTLTADEDGKYIFPESGSFVIFLVSPTNELIDAEVAYGWFEKRVCKKY
ncbi:DUF6143 family protein [Sporosarcina cyprini]|uniref:DUF6143 family protein n=1 Tax=Sporosarcina cyprini TaxID=2910523 RepID=UPI001EDDD186|nr:DUF6143 family protein [Sporosarcina cyprini]MCG3087334.1 DUF6143 family protein [Sporosarcina cyprini]